MPTGLVGVGFLMMAYIWSQGMGAIVTLSGRSAWKRAQQLGDYDGEFKQWWEEDGPHAEDDDPFALIFTYLGAEKSLPFMLLAIGWTIAAPAVFFFLATR